MQNNDFERLSLLGLLTVTELEACEWSLEFCCVCVDINHHQFVKLAICNSCASWFAACDHDHYHPHLNNPHHTHHYHPHNNPHHAHHGNEYGLCNGCASWFAACELLREVLRPPISIRPIIVLII